jgi:hypothetical protein
MDGGVCHLVHFCCMEMGAGDMLPRQSEAIVLEAILENNTEHVQKLRVTDIGQTCLWVYLTSSGLLVADCLI